MTVARRAALGGGLAVAALAGAFWVHDERMDLPQPPIADLDPQRINPHDFGAVGDGESDDRVALQHCLDAASAVNGTVVLTKSYALHSTLNARSNSHLRFVGGARLIRRFGGRALLSNERFEDKITNFQMTGDGVIDGKEIPGQTLFLFGDDLVLSGFTITNFAGGQAILIGGDRNRVREVTTTNPEKAPGTGGIRMFGGHDFLARGCNVTSGDDAFQFTPIATPDHPLRDLSIDTAQYVDCSGRSEVARLAVVILSTSPPGAGGMTASITGVAFQKCSGSAGRRGIVVANTDSTGTISDVTFSECEIDLSAAESGEGYQEILVQRSPGAGPVRTLRFKGVAIISPRSTAFGTRGDAEADAFVEDIHLENCLLNAPADGNSTVKLLGVRDCRISGGRIEGSGAKPTISGGVGPNAAEDLHIDGVALPGVADITQAVRLPATKSLRVVNCGLGTGGTSAKCARPSA